MALAVPEPLVRRIAAPQPLDLRRTLAPLRHGRFDPTIRFAPDGVWLALGTRAGPATLHLDLAGETLLAEAWGAGAAAALEAAPELAGTADEPAALVAHHPVVAALQRRFAGVRLPRTGAVVAALVPAVCEQKVTSTEAHRAYEAIVRRLGEPAPGPARLRLPPASAALAALPSYAYHSLGLERSRAELLRRIGRLGPRLEALAALDGESARTALRGLPGIGPWTAAETTRIALGDPDALSVGDAHIPSLVTWLLAGEPHGDDARMLELLEPYRGQRARVVRLLEAAGRLPPRFGPRLAPRRIERI